MLLLHEMTSKASVVWPNTNKKSSVCANPALLEKENNSGYYTAQEGLSFTVVEQSATHPRSKLKLTVVKTTEDSRAMFKNMAINNWH
jgi:hypothetical protein